MLNYVEALGADEGTYNFLSNLDGKDGFDDWGALDKTACAAKILDAVETAKQA